MQGTPLTMVAPRSDDSRTAAAVGSDFRLATGVMLGSFSPRGAPARFPNFKEDLLEAMRRATPRVPLVVLDGPPIMDQVGDRFRGATIEEKKKVLADAMSEYQVHNTNLWDIVRPALDLSGAYEALGCEGRREPSRCGPECYLAGHVFRCRDSFVNPRLFADSRI